MNAKLLKKEPAMGINSFLKTKSKEEKKRKQNIALKCPEDCGGYLVAICQSGNVIYKKMNNQITRRKLCNMCGRIWVTHEKINHGQSFVVRKKKEK